MLITQQPLKQEKKQFWNHWNKKHFDEGLATFVIFLNKISHRHLVHQQAIYRVKDPHNLLPYAIEVYERKKPKYHTD
jgi:hypothetical protein